MRRACVRLSVVGEDTLGLLSNFRSAEFVSRLVVLLLLGLQGLASPNADVEVVVVVRVAVLVVAAVGH